MLGCACVMPTMHMQMSGTSGDEYGLRPGACAIAVAGQSPWVFTASLRDNITLGGEGLQLVDEERLALVRDGLDLVPPVLLFQEIVLHCSVPDDNSMKSSEHDDNFAPLQSVCGALWIILCVNHVPAPAPACGARLAPC
jgi:hypothetical protein